MLKNNEILYEAEKHIVFQDPYVNEILLALYDTNEQGYLLPEDISSVIITNTLFSGNTDIVSFNELIYFGNTEIAAGSFQGCTSLLSINLLKITSIGANAFDGCTSLESLGRNVLLLNIGNYAFRNCISLLNINLSLGATIGDNAFEGCELLQNINLTSATTISDNAFKGCEALQNINLTSVTTIGDNAFEGCDIDQPLYFNNIQNIGDYAFKDNTNLGVVVINTESVPTCGINPFIGCTNLYAIYVPDELYDSFLAADNWQNYLNCIYPLSRKLPDDYTLGTYIASTKTGGQYIDLLYTMWDESPLSYTIDLLAEFIGNGKDNHNQATLLNAKREVSPYPGLVIRKTGNNDIQLSRRSKLSNTTDDYGNMSKGVMHITKSEDNISIDTHSVSTTLFAGYNSNGNPLRYIEAKVFYCKLKTNSDTWERDLIPCKDANDIPGLYDLVNKVFYKSLSAEPFEYEPFEYFLNKYVYFEDIVAANKCKELFGEHLTIEKLNTIGVTCTLDWFKNSLIKKFNEFKYFTNLGNNNSYISLTSMFTNSTLEEVTIPASSKGYSYGWNNSYGDRSPFYNCSNLIKVNLNGALFNQDYCLGMYNKCTSLPFSESLIPSNFTILPHSFFVGCMAMTHIIIPEGIITVNGNMIYGATNVEYVIFPTTLTSWNMWDFNRDGRANDIYLKRSSSITNITNTDGNINHFKNMNIYVADNLLADYQADTNWAALLSKYPNNIKLYSDNNLPAKLQEYKEINN